ncbi:hypothetical protein ACQP2P_15140 [Dactylosporangium sp. CA-139114]|uniref:hypothetical protein n=1 Tax=Dactylosporangium sp. CA-139114 TaxID=3239931 RepID=UPI003D98316A
MNRRATAEQDHAQARDAAGVLAAAGVPAVALTWVERGDPAALGPGDRPPRLPATLPEAIERLRADAGLRDAMGDALFEALPAVRRGGAELFAGREPDDVVAATRRRY